MLPEHGRYNLQRSFLLRPPAVIVVHGACSDRTKLPSISWCSDIEASKRSFWSIACFFCFFQRRYYRWRSLWQREMGDAVTRHHKCKTSQVSTLHCARQHMTCLSIIGKVIRKRDPRASTTWNDHNRCPSMQQIWAPFEWNINTQPARSTHVQAQVLGEANHWFLV